MSISPFSTYYFVSRMQESFQLSFFMCSYKPRIRNACTVLKYER
jgi:hypothetical protein